MEPKETGKAYDSITHIWQSDDFDMQNGIEAVTKAIHFTEQRGHALDIGCGCTGRFTRLLLEQGFTVEGLDVSAEMVKKARELHPDLTFYHQDIYEWKADKQYDFILAWDSLWHLPLEKQESVMRKVIQLLNHGGVFILSFGGTDEAGSHTNRFMGPEVYYSSLGLNGFIRLFMEMGCILRHLEFDQYPELHTYLIVEKP